MKRHGETPQFEASEMTTIIEGIAERIGDISYADLPREAVHWAKAAILDTVGVTLAGAGRAVHANRRARAVGRRRRERGRMPDLRHRSPRRAARRRADQRHRRARARFRRCQQFDGRPSLGADRAGAVRARAKSSTAPGAISSPPMSPGSRPRPGSAVASICIITKRAGTRPRRWACSARPRPAVI